MSESPLDVLVIGSGTSAHYCAHGLREAGKTVTVVDEREFGGTCALRGCQPKKYLVANAEAIAMASHLVGRGIASAPVCPPLSVRSNRVRHASIFLTISDTSNF